MRVRSSLKLVSALAVLVYGVASVASSPDAEAQPAPAAAAPAGSASAPAATPPASGATSGQGGTVGFQRKTSLTPAEQVAESAKHIARMEQSAAGVRTMLAEARKQRDVVKTLCLNDKLSQVDVAIRSGRDRATQLQAAANRNDTELASHEFTILTVLRQRSEQLVAEANQCIGEESAFIGDTHTSVTIDPEIPPDETPYPSMDPTLVIPPPPCTSCTL